METNGEVFEHNGIKFVIDNTDWMYEDTFEIPEEALQDAIDGIDQGYEFGSGYSCEVPSSRPAGVTNHSFSWKVLEESLNDFRKNR